LHTSEGMELSTPGPLWGRTILDPLLLPVG
jgi:hypothetical protein